jgi:hypothetical protein
MIFARAGKPGGASRNRSTTSKKEYHPMAKKIATRSAVKSTPVASTAVRNSPIPKTQSASRVITHEMIAKRAYEISQSPQAGSQYDNWIRAERELRAGK